VLQQEHDAVSVRISRGASAPAPAREYRRFRAKSGPVAHAPVLFRNLARQSGPPSESTGVFSKSAFLEKVLLKNIPRHLAKYPSGQGYVARHCWRAVVIPSADALFELRSKR
jgi:hypothetical protein